ncbi:MAG TPA: lipoate--protein ligase, partial [Clostridia bacterium]|nr:lipoate--protein ligase [Clostridia bacterium]
MSGEPNIISIFESDTYDVYQNQAAELAIFETLEEDEIALFLWTNERTVVIGRNQDALTECKVELLNIENGHLARRLSGGGAVYHDMGNLNFTFCAHKLYFDKKKNFEVILRAMKSCGFDVELSGRNDLTIGGKKFSGNAYYSDGNRNYHHGTILI